MARKTKLTIERIEIIKKGLSIGLTYDLAAKRAGIHPATLYRWLNGKGQMNRKLCEEIEKATAENAAQHLGVITKAAANGNWAASAWVLERRHGYRIGKRHEDVRDIQQKAALTDSNRVDFLKSQMIDLQALLKRATADESWQAVAKFKSQLFELHEQLELAKTEDIDDYEDMPEEEYRKRLAEAVQEWPEEHLAIAIEEFKARHNCILTIESAAG
mgnify:CR=1 FL=1